MIALAALLLATQPQASAPKARPPAARRAAPRPTREWLTGIWVEQKKPGVPDLAGCASWSALFYRADMTFTHDNREGTWELTGDRLVHSYFAAEPTTDTSLLAVDTATRSRVVRLGPDRMRKTLEGGRTATFVRCPKPETPVAD